MVKLTNRCLKITLTLFVIMTTCSLLLSCSSSPVAEVSDKSIQRLPTGRVHTVAQGETLYSIAFRYGLDYKSLASSNGISTSYKIYPGQKIRLNSVVGKATGSARIADSSTVTKPSNTTINSSEHLTSRSENKTQLESKSTVNKNLYGTLRWQWPASGKLLAPFEGDSGVNRGIDLGGKLGESVLAAASGHVVYSGSGLRGYGKLLIIKHNDIFLSAYAHNDQILVKEGDFVKAGQRIADMGSSGTDRVKLHFEIRSDGKPVDPLKFLPKR